jgi:hypothetical protein
MGQGEGEVYGYVPYGRDFEYIISVHCKKGNNFSVPSRDVTEIIPAQGEFGQ